MNQGESSTGLSIVPLKRRRGRPPKDPSLKRPSPARQNLLPPSLRPAEKPDPLVGHAVTGVIEAALDAGYLLNVRIGNSPTTFRGIVFKPGHYVPVTKENDVAPHLQMIIRNDVRPFDGLGLPQKRKYTSRRASGPPPPPPSMHPVGQRGNPVPVVLQPATHNFPNRLGQMLDFGDKDVHMVEPLSMLPPDSRSIPAGQIFLGGQPHGSHPVPPAQQPVSKEDEKGMFGEEENVGSLETESSDAEIASSDTSDSHYQNGKGFMKPPFGEDDLDAVSPQEAGNGNGGFPNEPLQNVAAFCYAPGRMTELLKAVHMKENQVQSSEQPIPGKKIELHETANTGVDPQS